MNNRLKIALITPMLLIIVSGLAYAMWTDIVTIHATLISAQAPTISAEKGFINLEHNLVTIRVRENDRIIISTSPDTVRIYVNVTNTGTTPINTIEVVDTLPEDWYLHPENVQVQLIQEDETTIEIGKSYFTVSYDADTRRLTVILHDILAATGKYLATNEKIRIMFNMHYALKKNTLPPNYEDNPPTYNNVATATARISGWSSQTATASASFETAINWVGSS